MAATNTSKPHTTSTRQNASTTTTATHNRARDASTASTRQLWMGGDDENGPKRRQTRRLGPKYVFFYILRFFSY